MAKLLILIIGFLVTILFFSCKKDANSGDNYYIKMKIDNKNFSFSDSLFATKQSSTPKLIIFGYSKTQGRLQWLFSDFSIGIYLDTYDTSIKKIIYQFTINAIIGYYNTAPVIEELMRPNPTVSNAITMTITNVNDNYVEGIFNGVLSDGSIATSTITNGQFKVPFK